LTDHSVSILGKDIGTTRVTLYAPDKKPVGVFDIEVSYDVSQLSRQIEQVAGHSIKVSSVNGRIMLSGTAPDAVTLDRAMTIARQFAKDQNSVINVVQVMQQQQVMLEVRFIEVDRTASRELGVQWSSGTSSSAGKGILSVGTGTGAGAGNGAVTTTNSSTSTLSNASNPNIETLANNSSTTTSSGNVGGSLLSGAAPFGVLVGTLARGNLSLNATLSALEERGLARSLAEPNLVALSGETASFISGGEFFVPGASATGTPTSTNVAWGVGLSFTPTVLKDGLIDLIIKPKVSSLDQSNTETIGGSTFPTLIIRQASTTLELRDGQTFMLGGLLQNTSNTTQSMVPWIGDVPVLGALFRSASYQKNETDLVIIVTPHIVHPLRPTDVVRTPLDNTLPANDVDFFLMGQAEVNPELARLAVGSLNRPYVGHALDLPKNGGAYVSVKD